MFPAFQAITYRVVRDFYHKYTVDEHTLLTMRNLERLAADGAGRERFASLLQDLRGAGAARARAAVPRRRQVARRGPRDRERAHGAATCSSGSGLRRTPRELVEFLIANHLAMSQVAFRRDTEDPEIVRQFAALVGVEERLKMLCLMTLADVEAVSLETLTPWKAELLWRLYVDTYNQLTIGYGDELIEPSIAADIATLLAEPSGGPVRERDLALPGGASRAGICSCSTARPSTGTCGSRATSTRTKSTCRSSRKARPGS